MALLDKVQKGKQHRPVFVCVFGVPGVGKTSFAASAPSPLVWCIERGADQIDVPKLPAPESWEAFKAELQELISSRHDYKSLGIDTLDALEVLAIDAVCRKGSKATLAEFSWGQGYALLAQEWRLFLKLLETLRDQRGMHIILIAHEHRKSFADPELGSFEMYRPKLQDKVWGLTNETCEAVLFAQFEQGLLEKDGQKARAIVSGRRVLRTQRGTGFFAKNRYGLPETIPLDWSTVESASHQKSLTALKAELSALLSLVNTEIKEKALAYLKTEGETEHAYRATVNRLSQLASQPASSNGVPVGA